MPPNTFWRSQRDTPQLAAGRVHLHNKALACRNLGKETAGCHLSMTVAALLANSLRKEE